MIAYDSYYSHYSNKRYSGTKSWDFHPVFKCGKLQKSRKPPPWTFHRAFIKGWSEAWNKESCEKKLEPVNVLLFWRRFHPPKQGTKSNQHSRVICVPRYILYVCLHIETHTHTCHRFGTSSAAKDTEIPPQFPGCFLPPKRARCANLWSKGLVACLKEARRGYLQNECFQLYIWIWFSQILHMIWIKFGYVLCTYIRCCN